MNKKLFAARKFKIFIVLRHKYNYTIIINIIIIITDAI